jgi:hypothetical protein
MMTPIAFGIVAAILAAGFTYLITALAYRDRVHEARVIAETERVRREAESDCIKRIRLEQQPPRIRTEGLLFKKKYLVISERLFLDSLPITGLIEHEKVLTEDIDSDKLMQLANAASLLLPPNGATVITKLIGKK